MLLTTSKIKKIVSIKKKTILSDPNSMKRELAYLIEIKYARILQLIKAVI